MTDRTGANGVGQLVIGKRQIVNGGQTACSLAEALNEEGEQKMAGKEVLLKVVSEPKELSPERLAEFIELISAATNQQTRVVEADRRANDPKMRRIQDCFYDTQGLFLEKKRGEFSYGVKDKYLLKTQIVDRGDLIRNYLAFSGEVAKARTSETAIFEESAFETLLADFDERGIFLSYLVAKQLENAVRPFKKKPDKPIYASGYAKYAILAACGATARRRQAGGKDVDQEGKAIVELVLEKWSEFEQQSQRAPQNAKYSGPAGFSFDNYYKGETIDAYVKTFFA
jgi:hypothetical protein